MQPPQHLTLQLFRKAGWRALRSRVRPYETKDPEVREVMMGKASSVPPSLWSQVLEIVALHLLMKALLSPLGTITNFSPRCPV